MTHKSKAVRDWIALRVAALVAIPLVIWFVYSIVSLAGADYAAFTGWLRQPFNAGLMILFVVVTFYHAALGCHEIIEDYVHHEGLKHATLICKALAFIAVGAACVLSVLKVAGS